MNKIKFHSPVIVSGQEKKLLNKVLISKEWSSFRGSTKNPLKVVSITSKEASKKGPLECMFLGGKYVRKLEDNLQEILIPNSVSQPTLPLLVYQWQSGLLI